MTAELSVVLTAGSALLTVVAVRAGVAAARAGTVTRRLPPRPVPVPPAPRWLAGALADAGLPSDPADVWRRLPLVVGAIALIGMLLGGPVLAVLMVGAAVGTAAAWLRSRRGQAELRIDRSLPVALEAVARSLRSGAGLTQALGESADAAPAPLASELRRVVDEAAAGAGLVAALERFSDRHPSATVRLAVAAMALGVDTGGAQARAIDGVAATVRDRLAVEAEVRALSAQARASAVVITVAPVAFGAIAAASDRRTAVFLLRTPIGLACLIAGLALDALSWLWMRRLMRVAP